MNYDVELRRLSRVPVLFVHRETTIAGIGPALGDAYASVWHQMEQGGAQPAGPPYARYLSVVGDRAVYEAGVPLSKAVAGEGEVEAGELPEGEAAVVLHIGQFDQMQPAYAAIEAWMQEQGRTAAGSPWESYLTDPAEEPDMAKWRTEIFWPLA